MSGPKPPKPRSGGSQSAEGGGDVQERRGGRRRSYNRRLDDQELSPPYFDIFERIAGALEGIEEELRARSVRLPDAEQRPTRSADRS